MNPLPASAPEIDILAFIDESGARGYSRNLTPARDHELGLVCALLFPALSVKEFRDAFRPGYQLFLDAMPDGAKLHITDAFASGNERWAAVAHSVRSEFQGLIRRLEIPVIFEARRLAVERDAHEQREDMVSRAKAIRRSPVRIPDRPSRSTVEEQLVFGLALKLDAFCEDAQCRGVDLMFDELDAKVAQRYEDAINRTRNIGRSTRRVKGWNPKTKSCVEGQISFRADAPFPLNTRFLGHLCVAGKQDPLILATDIVANSLYDHLVGLPATAYLNRPQSIAGWELEHRIYGARDDAIEDIF
ncbi:MAG: hypothetical protein OXF88_08955 [Rhodobacteraceae bacterium]|nr:hypothetical protein [Paracoccaceae bacterium]MCY4139818.1 hypothetical protein [Paracoccaceae bacterium]